jgi:hypothetical protein
LSARDAIEDPEAWWVYMVLVERVYETMPDEGSRRAERW